jgi:hypothetical protein
LNATTPPESLKNLSKRSQMKFNQKGQLRPLTGSLTPFVCKAMPSCSDDDSADRNTVNVTSLDQVCDSLASDKIIAATLAASSGTTAHQMASNQVHNLHIIGFSAINSEFAEDAGVGPTRLQFILVRLIIRPMLTSLSFDRADLRCDGPIFHE